MRFIDDKRKWINFNPDFPSNHRGTYKIHGEWAEPVFPSNISLAGSPATPYIFDDRCSPEDAAQALLKVYLLGKEERTERGLKGREWAMSDEAQMSAVNMSKNVVNCMEEGFKNFKPRPKYEIHKAGPRPSKYIEHKLISY